MRLELNITRNFVYRQEKAIEFEVCALKIVLDSVVVSFLIQLASSLQSSENDRIRLSRQENAKLNKAAELVTIYILVYISYSIFLVD